MCGVDVVAPEIRSTEPGALGGVVVLAHSLAAHSWFWRIGGRGQGLADVVTDVSFMLAEHQDRFYIVAVKASAVFSMTAILILAAIFLWSALKKQP